MCGGWGTMKLLRSAYLWRGGEKIPIIWLSSHPVTSSIQHPVSPTVNTTGTVLYVSFTGYVLPIPRFPPLRAQMSTHLQSAASACFTDMAHAVFVFREKMQKSTSTVNILTCRYGSKSSRWRPSMDKVGRSIEFSQLSLSDICNIDLLYLLWSTFRILVRMFTPGPVAGAGKTAKQPLLESSIKLYLRRVPRQNRLYLWPHFR